MSTNGIGVDMQNIRRFVVVVGVGALVLGAGCGSSDDGSLYDEGSGGSSAAAGSSAAGTGASSSGGSSGGGTGGSSASGGSSGGGTGGSSASGGSGGSGGSAAGAGGVGGSAGSGVTGGSGGSATGGQPGSNAVNCGGPICDVSAGQQCCDLPNEAPKCFNPDQEGCSCGLICDETVIACDGPEDCPSSEVCCAERGITGQRFDRVLCSANCTDGITTRRSEVCHSSVSGGCSTGSCSPSGVLPAGYGICE